MVKATHRLTVTQLHQEADLVDLTVRTDDGATITIHTTNHHPFWSGSRQGWINAADLAPGDRLRALDTRTPSPSKPYVPTPADVP